MPPNSPVSIDDRVTAVIGAAVMACIVFGVGFAIHKAISKNSNSKRIQGRPIVWWVTVLYFLGACLGAWMADNRMYIHEAVGGMGAFGLLIGLAIGNINGCMDLYRARRDQPAVLAFCTDGRDSGSLSEINPYDPPKHPG